MTCHPFRAISALGIIVLAAMTSAAETPNGRLMIVGGGLRPDNASIFQRLIEAAGGAAECRIAVFPTAGKSAAGAERFKQTLEHYGVPAERVTVIDLRPENAERMAFDPAVVEEIRHCTGAFFTGGDQRRITTALLRADGGDTPALQALRELWKRGGVIAGTSAGAAMQSDVMIAVSGLPDEALDEGMDALDFGVVRDPLRRGLLVTKGLGFFSDGIIDQHFNQFRGRLTRLARATISEQVRFGFGIDENTALLISGDELEVLGQGCLTLLDSKDAACEDSPLGCTIRGLRISCLQGGDRFNLRAGEATIHPAKAKITPGKEYNRGNFLISDIAAEGAVRLALFDGLAQNTSRKQSGIMLRYTHNFGHGYRVTFRKTDRTAAWSGVVNYSVSTAIQDVEATIEPILVSLQPPASGLPRDLPEGGAATPLKALWFRGIFLADEQGNLRPEAPITRSELATALAHAVHLLPPRDNPRLPPDLPADADWADDALKVLEAGLMQLDEAGMFRPDVAVSRQDAAWALAKLHAALNPSSGVPAASIKPQDEVEISETRRDAVCSAVQAGLLSLEEGRFRPMNSLSRQGAALALYIALGFPW